MGDLDDLLSQLDSAEPFDYELEDVRAAQLGAIDERFQLAIGEIPVLRRQAEAAGVAAVTSLEDVLPLLFSHTSYKSYPMTLIRDRKWAVLGRWLDNFSIGGDTTALDFSAIETIDDWLEELHGAGRFAFASSGTSGKSSILNCTQVDVDRTRRTRAQTMFWATGVPPDRSRATFILWPSRGTHRMIRTFRGMAEDFGRPDAIHWLTDEPMLLAQLNEVGEINRRIADGVATPGEITEFEASLRRRAERMSASHEDLVDEAIKARGESVVILGPLTQHWALAESIESRGEADLFDPASAVLMGGGAKGVSVPVDHKERIAKAYGIPQRQWQQVYGMVEIISNMPMCDAGRYHVPPWLVPVVVDKAALNLAQPEDGVLQGRMAFVDLSIDGRWNALVTGDAVRVDLGHCSCGRRSPTVITIDRFADLAEGEEKLSCASTVDAYVRGVLST